jgi:hypothetical protein
LKEGGRGCKSGPDNKKRKEDKMKINKKIGMPGNP